MVVDSASVGEDDSDGGPFADRSGGLITFEADSAAQAEGFVARDPFMRGDLIAAHWTKEWIIDNGAANES